ncbi:putative DNA-binding protein (MmcQ/YjbR family) [Pontibacter aydingkolensis]|uniref:MmcQ/YjbR family DNA-binding protein n=1 Tax=Pontibacter aydingkolensis TaxID=1911536 RepID=A0ABS7CTM4_9BACT|nr:MmcQ/YjbR family DNA-binding protein [Pontibacter aydingkolensis]MBW7467192.1 MmcQ/YjbR family DNA-binding protein [Pontibacter aydingkolensis]
MNIEALREFCLGLPGVTEDVKWGADLCFLVREKMFCVTSIDAPHSVSFKVTAEQFDEMVSRPGIIPAPYMARNKWINVQEWNVLNDAQWETYVKQSYALVKAKLPKKLQKEIEANV